MNKNNKSTTSDQARLSAIAMKNELIKYCKYLRNYGIILKFTINSEYKGVFMFTYDEIWKGKIFEVGKYE